MREVGLDARHFEIYERVASSGIRCIYGLVYDEQISGLLNDAGRVKGSYGAAAVVRSWPQPGVLLQRSLQRRQHRQHVMQLNRHGTATTRRMAHPIPKTTHLMQALNYPGMHTEVAPLRVV